MDGVQFCVDTDISSKTQYYHIPRDTVVVIVTIVRTATVNSFASLCSVMISTSTSLLYNSSFLARNYHH